MLGWTSDFKIVVPLNEQEYDLNRLTHGFTLKKSEDRNLMQYCFNRKYCLRLDELIKLIFNKNSFQQNKNLCIIKLHLGQALKLIDAILHKILSDQQKHLSPGNLNAQNVWIILKDGSDQFSYRFAKLDYQIIFVNYSQNGVCIWRGLIEQITQIFQYCSSKKQQRKWLEKYPEGIFQQVENEIKKNFQQIKGNLLNQELQLIKKAIQEFIKSQQFEEKGYDNLKNYDCSQYSKVFSRRGKVKVKHFDLIVQESLASREKKFDNPDIINAHIDSLIDQQCIIKNIPVIYYKVFWPGKEKNLKVQFQTIPRIFDYIEYRSEIQKTIKVECQNYLHSLTCALNQHYKDFNFQLNEVDYQKDGQLFLEKFVLQNLNDYDTFVNFSKYRRDTQLYLVNLCKSNIKKQIREQYFKTFVELINQLI